MALGRRPHNFIRAFFSLIHTVPLEHFVYKPYLYPSHRQGRIQRGLLELPPPSGFKCPVKTKQLRPNYFIFMGYLRKIEIKSAKRTPSFTHLNSFPEILYPPLLADAGSHQTTNFPCMHKFRCISLHFGWSDFSQLNYLDEEILLETRYSGFPTSFLMY